MQKRLKVLITILFISLVISDLFFTYKYMESQRILEKTIKNQVVNSNVLLFTQLFVQKVLRGSDVVSFEDRLLLENSVRALNDERIFASWENFTRAKNTNEVQNCFYNLFDLLLKKIAI